MLCYLPENIYKKNFADNKKYHDTVSKLYKEYITDCDLYFIGKTSKSNNVEARDKFIKFLKSNCAKEDKKELELILNDNTDEYLKDIDKFNDEIKIYLKYIKYANLVPSEELFKNFQDIVSIYENSKYIFSDYIHAIYYFTKMYLNIPKALKNEISPLEIINKDKELFNDMMKKSSSESFKNIMYSKHIHFLSLYTMGNSLYHSDGESLIFYVLSEIEKDDFKYNDVYFFKLMIYHTLFKYYFETSQDTLAVKYLKKILESIKYGFENKEILKKSLIHYNKIMTTQFLYFCKYMYQMIETVPKLKIIFDFNTVKNISDDELNYIKGKLEPYCDDMEKDFSWFNANFIEINKNILQGYNRYV